MKKKLTVLLLLSLAILMCACSSSAKGKNNSEELPTKSGAEKGDEKGSEKGDETKENNGKTPDENGNETEENYGPKSILYNMKINPEFEIAADDNLVVIEVVAKNEDAEKVLASVNVVGLGVNEAFGALADEAKTQGFLTVEKANTVNITILEKDDEKMPTCHLCNGGGTVVCLECHGTGVLGTCALCEGAREFHCKDCGDSCWIVCPECHGSNYSGLTKEFVEERKKALDPPAGCWNCHGSGVCSYCNGTGAIIVTNGDDGSIKYKADGTPETSPCVSCKGNGVCSNCIGNPEWVERQSQKLRDLEKATPCWLCNANGKSKNPGYIACPHTGDPYFIVGTCPECNGAGVMYCGDSFNGYNWCPCCWGSGVEGTGDPNYREYYPDPTE